MISSTCEQTSSSVNESSNLSPVVYLSVSSTVRCAFSRSSCMTYPNIFLISAILYTRPLSRTRTKTLVVWEWQNWRDQILKIRDKLCINRMSDKNCMDWWRNGEKLTQERVSKQGIRDRNLHPCCRTQHSWSRRSCRQCRFLVWILSDSQRHHPFFQKFHNFKIGFGQNQLRRPARSWRRTHFNPLQHNSNYISTRFNSSVLPNLKKM